MNVLDCVETWLRSLRGIFEAAGIEVRFQRTADQRPKASLALNLRRELIEVDLLLWDSGEADLATIGMDGEVKLEHFENLLDPNELGSVLSRVAEMMRVTVA